MKTLILLLLSSALHAAPYTLRWDKNPAAEAVIEYGVYRIEQGAPVLLKKVVASKDAATTQNTAIEAEPGQLFAVRALNSSGESPLSDAARIPIPKPTKPEGIRVVEIQTSDNLTDWKPLAYVPLQDGSPKRFIRTAITTIPSP